MLSYELTECKQSGGHKHGTIIVLVPGDSTSDQCYQGLTS